MNPITLYRRLERLIWLGLIAWLARRYWPQIRQALEQLSGASAGSGLSGKAQQLASEATGKGRTIVQEVRQQVDQAAPAANVTDLTERARQMAASAGEKVQAATQDVRHRVGLGEEAGEGTAGAGESGDQGVSRFATEYSQSDQSGDVATETGIPTASHEASMAMNQHTGVGGIGIDREAAEHAAGGTLTDRPGETGVSRRSGEQQEQAYAFAGDMGVPIAESLGEENEPSVVDVDDVTADAIESSVSENEIGPDNDEAPDQPRTTGERASDEGYFSPTAELDTDDDTEDQGPWMAESASDLDMPAASRGALVYGEKSESYGDDVEGLSAETGEGFGREDDEGDDELLTTGGEIDLDNDEAPLTEVSATQDIVSLDAMAEDAADAFGGEDTALAGDTLGLRDSESEPIRAGQNDDVSMHVGTGGPEEEARDSDLGKREEDVSDDEGATTGDDDSTSGISGDYDTAAETQVIPAKPEDEEAGSPPSQGDVHENGATAPPAQATAATRASGSQGGRARNVPKGAILAPEGGTCPADFPIKGNANSRIYHMPGESSYDSTIPEYCFASEEDARGAGFRPRKR